MPVCARPAVAALALSLVCVPLQADDASQRHSEPVERFLNDVQTLSARFEQSLVDADNIVIESSSGELTIKRPGQFVWHYREPYEQLLIADGHNIWSYDVDLEQVTVKPQQDMLANTPAVLLGGNRDVLDEFEVLDSETDQRDTVWVTLRPRNPDNGFEQVELGFDNGVLQRMVFRDNLEQTTLIALLDVTLNEPVDVSLFSFDVPPGVDVVGQPVDAPATP